MPYTDKQKRRAAARKYARRRAAERRARTLEQLARNTEHLGAGVRPDAPPAPPLGRVRISGPVDRTCVSEWHAVPQRLADGTTVWAVVANTDIDPPLVVQLYSGRGAAQRATLVARRLNAHLFAAMMLLPEFVIALHFQRDRTIPLNHPIVVEDEEDAPDVQP